jgi:hypothetical protein
MFNQSASLPNTAVYFDPLTGQYYYNQFFQHPFYNSQQLYFNPHLQEIPNAYFYVPGVNMQQAHNLAQSTSDESKDLKVIITEVSDDEPDNRRSKDYVDAISLNGDT